ncbi:flippase-like domain-containing protein [Candidatus Woesearchaeota archaeon]|nr:flippase-like domain-containing protein [Candidatus Woesearchaeota archaeon]
MNGLTKKNTLAHVVSVVFGIAVFALVVKIAGLENIISSVKGFSPRYLLPFLAATLGLWVAASYRWKVVLQGEGVRVPLWTLFRYRLMVFSISYLTPVARMAGEPFKVMLLRSQRVRASKSFASIILDNFIGVGFDAIIGGVLLIIIFFTSSLLPLQIRVMLLSTGVLALVVVALLYFVLIRRKGIFSDVLDIAGIITKIGGKKFFLTVKRRVAAAELYIRSTLMRKPKQVMLVSFYAALSWPLAILQYKFALLMLGVDASVAQIVLSIAVMAFTAIIPIPASLGVQEAGQFSVFKILGMNPHLGIALSFIIRLKDIIVLYLSFWFLSMEGFNFVTFLNKKLRKVLNNSRKNGKTRAKKR